MTRCWFLAAALLAVTCPAAAEPRLSIDVQPGRLADAVTALGTQAHVTIGTGERLPGVRSPGAHGRLSVRAALARVLGGSGWHAVRLDAGVFRLEPNAPTARRKQEATALAEEIVVTGTKRDERLSSIPFAATVVRLDIPRLADRVATTADIAANSEGLGITNLGPGRNRLFLRGVADGPFNGPTQSTVGVYLDDVRLGFAAPDPDLRLVDVERVEVLRGPQGTLYGTGALGGVYRIVPSKPSIDDGWSGRVGVGGAATLQGAPSAGFDAAVNAPVTDDVAARVVGYVSRDGGWIDDRRRRRTAINTVDVTGGRAALRWTPSVDWTVDLSGALQRIEVADGQYAVAAFGARARGTAIAQPSGNDFNEGSLAVTGHVGGARLASTTAYVGRALDSRYDAGGGTVFDERQTERLLSHETRLSRTAAHGSWLVGVTLLSAHSNLEGQLTNAPAAPVAVEHLERAVLEGAIFGEARRTFFDRLDLTLGTRLSDTSIRDDAGAGGVTVTRLRLSPTAALLWRPLAGFEVYGRWANAFRPGGLTGTTGAQSGTFRSDKLRSLDFGIRARRGVVAAEFSLFDIIWRDVQSDLLQTNGLIATANIGRTRILGGDLALGARWPSGWRIDGSVAVQQGELHRTGPRIVGDIEAGLPSAPAFTARLGGGRAFDLAGVAIGADASLRYVGPSRLSFDTALNRRMGDYAVLDMDLSAVHGAWRIGLGVSNALDTHADTFAFGNPFTVRREVQRAPVRPARVRLRIERRF